MKPLDPESRSALDQSLRDPAVSRRLLRDTRAQRGRRDDDDHARDLVQDAIVATLDGTRTWHRSCVDLPCHLRSAIRSQSSHDDERARRFPHDRKEIDDDTLEDLGATEREELRRHAREVVNAVRRLSAGDPHVLLVLDAYAQDAFDRSEVVELTKLTVLEYEAARDRLIRLRDDLPAALQPVACASRTRSRTSPRGSRPPKKSPCRNSETILGRPRRRP